jgi:hypothetical protein
VVAFVVAAFLAILELPFIFVPGLWFCILAYPGSNAILELFCGNPVWMPFILHQKIPDGVFL